MPQPAPVFEQLLSPPQTRSLEALASDAWGGAGRLLGAILGADPALVDPGARLVMPDEIAGEFGDPHIVIHLGLAGTAAPAGSALVVLGASLASRFVDAGGADPGDADQQDLAPIATMAAQLVEAVNATTFAALPGDVSLTLGDVTGDAMPALIESLDEPCILFEGLLNAGRALPFRVVLPASFLEALAATGGAFAPQAEDAPAAEMPAFEPEPQPAAVSPAIPVREPTPIMAAPAAQRAHFSPLPEQTPAHAPANIDLLSDLQMSVSVELGRTELSVADVLALGSGSVIELDRLAGEPVDILVNDRLIARGEVVVVDENFGVRIVEVLPRSREVGKAS